MTTSGASRLRAIRQRIADVAVDLRRDLPWIGETDGWAVLVSEVMLQQTQVARVIERWPQFMAAFPTPAACAAAPLGEVLVLWRGMGYNRRAQNLHRAARQIVDEHGGEVPRSVRELESLAGVGPYTARAVASFAFGEPVGVLDTNVARILARAIENRPLGRADAQGLVDRLVGEGPSGPINQALMDLGARHCRRTPRCESCPLATRCRWRREGGEDPAVSSAGVSKPQGAFVGSRRQARGRLIEALRVGPVSLNDVRTLVGDHPGVIDDLCAEGLAVRARGRLTLPA